MIKERMVEHHIKYKEIHGYDKTIMMSHSKHIKLHNRLRKEGKCNIPVKELKTISDKAYARTKKAKEYQKEYFKNITEKQRAYRKEYNIEYKKNNKDAAAISNKVYRETHKEELKIVSKKYGKEYRETHKEEMATYQKIYRETHKEEIAKQRKKAYQDRRQRFTI